ncbi:MAG: hypothetical protein KA314_06610 [Chloroflexi bacterium]|nr:hypothetical protein [Chloroflexota bacterium]MBP8055496.1 hypothetical protein [Chloroflexota bacterium]
MSKTSAKVGTASGCLVWVVLVMVIGTCLLPVGLIVSVFTATSTAAAQTIGPLICPEGSVATIEQSNTAYRTDLGAEPVAATRELVCVDNHSTVITRPSPLTNWIWMGFIMVMMLFLAGFLAFVLAAPAGATVGILLQHVQKKRQAP